MTFQAICESGFNARRGAKTLPSALFAAALILFLAAPSPAAQDGPFLPNYPVTASTVPANGDVNPYGVAFVPNGFAGGGSLTPGNVLVSNFNNSSNLQGTGTTIVDIQTSGTQSLFFQGQGLLGLTTALNILRKGVVLVGNFPSPDGTCGNSSAGSILVINSQGAQIGALTDPNIDGPWDSAVIDEGNTAKLFVTNALSGTVARLNLAVSATGVTIQSSTQIASGYMHQCDAVTFVDAPAGLVYDASTDTLYVASTLDNAVYAVANASTTSGGGGTGTIVYQDAQHLHGALAMAAAPNGHLLVSNNDVINVDQHQPSEIVEFTKAGQFVKELSVDPTLGASFGLSTQAANNSGSAAFAYVNDVTSTLSIWKLPIN
jgi:hypothetical protein